MFHLQGVLHYDKRRQTDGHVDEEDPAPASDGQDVVGSGEEAADDGTQHTGGAEDGQEVALIFGPLAWRHDISEDGQRQGEQSTGS